MKWSSSLCPSEAKTMQTTITHTDGELVGYVGLGGQRALLVYPLWQFKRLGAVGSKALDIYRFDRGIAVHLCLFGFQWLSKRRAVKEGRRVQEDLLPNFVDPHVSAA